MISIWRSCRWDPPSSLFVLSLLICTRLCTRSSIHIHCYYFYVEFWIKATCIPSRLCIPGRTRKSCDNAILDLSVLWIARMPKKPWRHSRQGCSVASSLGYEVGGECACLIACFIQLLNAIVAYLSLSFLLLLLLLHSSMLSVIACGTRLYSIITRILKQVSDCALYFDSMLLKIRLTNYFSSLFLSKRRWHRIS